MKKTNKAKIDGTLQIKGGMISEPYLLQWFKRQSFFSILSYLFGMAGLLIMIDGIFFIPIEITRYGFSNESLDLAFVLLIFSMVTNNTHMIINKGE